MNFEKINVNKVIIYTILAIILLLVVPMAIRPLSIPDEARYAEASREVWTYNYWLYPHLNNVPHLTKPPLYYNLAALSIGLFGVNLFAVRFIPFITFLITMIFVLRMANKCHGKTAVFFTSVVGLTMAQNVFIAQFCDINMLLTMFLTLAMYYFFMGITEENALGKWYLGCVVAGLAFLTKGPPALVLPLGSIIFYRYVSGKKFKISAGHIWGGVIVFLLVATPWYIWTIINEGEKLKEFWYKNVFRRTGVNNKFQFFYMVFIYIPYFLLGSSLWAGLITWGGIKSVYRNNPGLKFLAFPKAAIGYVRTLPAIYQWLFCYVFFTIVFFSITGSSMLTYIQPIYPSFAMLAGMIIADRIKEGKLNAASVKKFASGTAIFTVFAIWGAAAFFLFSGKYEKNDGLIAKALPKHELYVMAQKVKQMKGTDFELIQAYYKFNPIFNFQAEKLSSLCNSSVYDEWDKESGLEKKDVNQKIENNEKIIVFVLKKKAEKFNLDSPNVKILYEGKEFVLFSTF